MASQPKLAAVPAALVSIAEAGNALGALTDALAALPGADDVKLSFNGAFRRIDVSVVMQASADPAVALHILSKNQIAGYHFTLIATRPSPDPKSKFRRVITAVAEDAA